MLFDEVVYNLLKNQNVKLFLITRAKREDFFFNKKKNFFSFEQTHSNNFLFIYFSMNNLSILKTRSAIPRVSLRNDK